MAVKNRKKASSLAAVDQLAKDSDKLADKLADRTYGSEEQAKEKVKRLGIDMPESTYEAFFMKARKDKTNMSTLIRDWIDGYLKA